MPTVIKLKRGTTTPTTSNIVSGEIAVDTSAQKLYINDASTIKTIGLGNPSVSDISDLTATAAELNILDGVTATTAELNYTDGVTSNIQTQLDAKSPIASPTFTGTLTAPTADINGGTIDGTVIGGASAAAGTFTTVLATDGVLEARSGAGGPDVVKLNTITTLSRDQGSGVLTISTNAGDIDMVPAGGDVNVTGNVLLSNAAGPAMLNEAATSTNPTHVPNKADLDTGIGWVSADIGVGIAGGAEAFRWDSSGSIQLQGNLNFDDGNVLLARDGTSFRMVTNASLPIALRTVDAQPILFKTTNTERMRIDSSGEVGINTTSGGAKLRVSKGASTSAGIFEGSGYQTYFGYGGNDDNYLSAGTSGSQYFRRGSTIDMTINSSGNVGIGVTPTYKLDIGGVTESIFRNTGGSVQSAVYSSGGGSQGQFGTFSAHPTVLITSGTERMRIDTSGNVGIGTSSPAAGYKLDVNGSIGGPSAAFAIYPSPGVSAKRTFSGSNNSNATLHIDHEGGYNRFGCDNTSQHFAFTAGGSTSSDINVVFKGDGTVGIGTTSPSYKLDVAGDINYTGTLYNNGVASGSPAQVLIKNSSGTTIKIRVGLNAGGSTTNIKNSAGTAIKTVVGPFVEGEAAF